MISIIMGFKIIKISTISKSFSASFIYGTRMSFYEINLNDFGLQSQRQMEQQPKNTAIESGTMPVSSV